MTESYRDRRRGKIVLSALVLATTSVCAPATAATSPGWVKVNASSAASAISAATEKSAKYFESKGYIATETRGETKATASEKLVTRADRQRDHDFARNGIGYGWLLQDGLYVPAAKLATWEAVAAKAAGLNSATTYVKGPRNIDMFSTSGPMRGQWNTARSLLESLKSQANASITKSTRGAMRNVNSKSVEYRIGAKDYDLTVRIDNGIIVAATEQIRGSQLRFRTILVKSSAVDITRPAGDVLDYPQLQSTTQWRTAKGLEMIRSAADVMFREAALTAQRENRAMTAHDLGVAAAKGSTVDGVNVTVAGTRLNGTARYIQAGTSVSVTGCAADAGVLVVTVSEGVCK